MTHSRPSLQAVDFEKTPFVAIWETTRACDLACRHCRAEAMPTPLPGELNTEEGFELLDNLADMGTPICVLSGGDPAKREDLLPLVEHGTKLGMRMATIPAGTPALTAELVSQLKFAGLAQMALSLDGPTAELHDGFRNTPGAFEQTLRGAHYAHDAGLALQINTVLGAHNREHFGAMAALVRELKPVFWEVFFLVPTGRGRELEQLNAADFEALFEELETFARGVDFIVKVTEAPHYRRFLMERRRSSPERVGRIGKTHPSSAPTSGKDTLPAHMRRDFGPRGSIGLAPKGVNSGKGHLFVSYCGDVFPSGFLPLGCGNIRERSLASIYRNHPVFRELRDTARLGGKCGRCEFRDICGGSRARAYAMTGDYLAEEPFCAYEPPN